MEGLVPQHPVVAGGCQLLVRGVVGQFSGGERGVFYDSANRGAICIPQGSV